LCFFPKLATISYFTDWLKLHMKNISLSTQRFYDTGRVLQEKVKELNGLFIPAHVFTPFKSLYGKGVKSSLTEVLHPELIDAVELGLSTDTQMADQLQELHAYPFVTNSDSHSLKKIAREYQQIRMKQCSFVELQLALHQRKGRRILANYGMNPMLGKYYSTVCQACLAPAPFGRKKCPTCNSSTVVSGVCDRIQQLKDTDVKPNRPNYYYQLPLEYIPGLGQKTLKKLIDSIGTEMNIIHHLSYDRLKQVVPHKIAQAIIDMRTGIQTVQ